MLAEETGLAWNGKTSCLWLGYNAEDNPYQVAQAFVEASGAEGEMAQALLERVAKSVTAREAGVTCGWRPDGTLSSGRYEGEPCESEPSEWAQDKKKKHSWTSG